MSGENELVIFDNTPEFTGEVLKAVPRTSVPLFRLSFTALSNFGEAPSVSDEDTQRYINQCINSNIVPFSHLRLTYDWGSDRFAEKSVPNSPVYYLKGMSTEIYDSIHELILKGGKHHKVTYFVEYVESGTTGYSFFIDKVLDKLSPDYTPSNGFVAVKTKYARLGNPPEGGYDTAIAIHYSNPGKISLETNWRASEEDAQFFGNWFREVAQANNKLIGVPANSSQPILL